ncbi:hypothetical protein K443DRAFT_110577, partial [Laccaria amethystina LaAM-08-1]
IVTEMVDGWIEVPIVHEPIVRNRFEKKNLLRLRGTENSRSCPTPLNDPLESPSSKGDLFTDVG